MIEAATFRPQFDGFGRASLDGTWEFFPGDHVLGDLDKLSPDRIPVPALWEAQGYLDLDGTAWYRRRFELADTDGSWTLCFGAVMDVADVFLNREFVGHHELPFTPFEFDVGSALRPGVNELAVRVVDPPLTDPEHFRLPHGKQGWMNHVFPSRPSLYLTYGGIWQPVQLRRHGPVLVANMFVNGDPDDLVVAIELQSRVDEPLDVIVGVRLLGTVRELAVEVPPRAMTTATLSLGSTTADRWSPASPFLHDVVVNASAKGRLSDIRISRFGLRTVRVDGERLLVNGQPYRMRSALVQGFTADRLYAEGTRQEIEAEVRAAQAMGFNTLRLHIKAFDPLYLAICDELGMFVHSDLPVAEPIAHDEMGDDSVLVRRSVAAIAEQVRRDRNHPSIILWSAMNELCDGRREARQWPQYEHFARTLVAAVKANDHTRPVIENDWVEPDPSRVFDSPILTAHWYGQLHADYFDKIEAACQQWSGLGRPFFVTEFGDWGLPEMPALEDPEFWDTRALYEAALAANLWPGTIGRFVQETQRYQGLADRLQMEVWRRHNDIGGYCLTELTDVPHELNGLLDLHRRPKPLAVEEVARGNQAVLPMLEVRTLVVGAGEQLEGLVRIANDGPSLDDATVQLRFGDTSPPLGNDQLAYIPNAPLDLDALQDRFAESVTALMGIGTVPANTCSLVGRTSIVAPTVPGNHDLVVRLFVRGVAIADNRYPIQVVDTRAADVGVRIIGDGTCAAAVAAAGGRALVDAGGHATTTVVGEDSLDPDVRADLEDRLRLGEVVLMLAQSPDRADHYPADVTLTRVATAWGSTVFHFTTDHGALPSLPRRNVLVAEDSTIQATSVVTAFDGRPFPETPVVLAFKPVPSPLAGTIIGAADVGAGRLVFCQYRLTDRAADGDAAARALFADLLRWCARPRPVMQRHEETEANGRHLTAYRWDVAVAR